MSKETDSVTKSSRHKLIGMLANHRKKIAAALGTTAYVVYAHYKEMNAEYAVKTSIDWYDETCGEAAKQAPVKYRDLKNSTYFVHTMESFDKLDKSKLTLKDLREARVGSVTNACLRTSNEQALPERRHWLEVMEGTTAGLNANAWAILASAKESRDKLMKTTSQWPFRWIWSSRKGRGSRDQFKMLEKRDEIQKNATDAWHTLQRSLLRAAYLAEAGYSIEDFAGLPTSHAIRDEIGKFGCVIESPLHPHAVAIGYKLLPRRVTRGTETNTASDKIVIDMDVTIVFQGSKALIGWPILEWWPTLEWAADWLVTNIHIAKTTTKSTPVSPSSATSSNFRDRLLCFVKGELSFYRTLFREIPDDNPLPAGLRVHTGYYRRFKRIWPQIVQHIEKTRRVVTDQNPGHHVNVQVSVAGHSQAGALASLTAMAVDTYSQQESWHPGCGTDLFVFSAPALFGESIDGTIPNFDDTTVRCLRFSVDNDVLASLLDSSWTPDRFRLHHPSANSLQLSGQRCNVGTLEAHTDYSRLIREFVALNGIPQLHLLTAGSEDSTPDKN